MTLIHGLILTACLLGACYVTNDPRELPDGTVDNNTEMTK